MNNSEGRGGGWGGGGGAHARSTRPSAAADLQVCSSVLICYCLLLLCCQQLTVYLLQDGPHPVKALTLTLQCDNKGVRGAIRHCLATEIYETCGDMRQGAVGNVCGSHMACFQRYACKHVLVG